MLDKIISGIYTNWGGFQIVYFLYFDLSTSFVDRKIPKVEEPEKIIREAFDRDSKIWKVNLQHKTGYVFYIKERWWRDSPIQRNSDEWNYFHRRSIKIPEYTFKLNPREAKRKIFRLSFCYDFEKDQDIILVGIYHDDNKELEEKRLKRKI